MPSLMSDFLALPITQAARLTAQAFGQQQSTPEKAKQVYLNTLAVWAVKDYLSLMDIPSDLEASDSWNPVIRLCSDVADLVVPGFGRLECRPVLPKAMTCTLPPEVWSNRIGYVITTIDTDHRQAGLLGFSPAGLGGIISLNQLQPLESLLAHLSEFLPSLSPQSESAITTPPFTLLSQWLQGIFEQHWQQVKTLLPPSTPELAFCFRSAASTLDLDPKSAPIRRAKLIQFKDDAVDLSLVLILNLLQTDIDYQKTIRVQLCPSGDTSTLPANCVLRILDHQRTTFQEVQSRQVDNYLQLQFSGFLGEQFHLSLEYGIQTITETFMI